MKRFANILMAAAIGLAVVGTGVAIVQPGDMGKDTSTETADQDMGRDDPEIDDDPVVDENGDDGTSDTSASDSTSSTSTPSEDDATSTSTTSSSAPTSPETTPTTGGNSGFDADGPANPSDTSGGLADTGGETMILTGAALAAASLALRRRSDSV